MKLISRKELAKSNEFFEVLAGTGKSQIASMVLQPGQVSGEYGNEHPESDQILYVIDGKGFALVEKQRTELAAGDLVLIEAGEDHQIGCEGTEPLRTINFYSPPAY